MCLHKTKHSHHFKQIVVVALAKLKVQYSRDLSVFTRSISIWPAVLYCMYIVQYAGAQQNDCFTPFWLTDEAKIEGEEHFTPISTHKLSNSRIIGPPRGKMPKYARKFHKLLPILCHELYYLYCVQCTLYSIHCTFTELYYLYCVQGTVYTVLLLS